jgi:hypothetical protein
MRQHLEGPTCLPDHVFELRHAVLEFAIVKGSPLEWDQ